MASCLLATLKAARNFSGSWVLKQKATSGKPQASSDKLQAASLTNRIKGLYRIQTERNI